jgi:hypothetical protein
MNRKPTRKTLARERTAERIAVILADDDTPAFVWDVLTDMLIALSNETGVDVTTPQVARVALPLMLERAAKDDLRCCNGGYDSKSRRARNAATKEEAEFPALLNFGDAADDESEVAH